VWARSWWNIGQSSSEEAAFARNAVDAAQNEIKRITERITTADLRFLARNPPYKVRGVLWILNCRCTKFYLGTVAIYFSKCAHKK
jgi:hypothetical protein